MTSIDASHDSEVAGSSPAPATAEGAGDGALASPGEEVVRESLMV